MVRTAYKAQMKCIACNHTHPIKVDKQGNIIHLQCDTKGVNEKGVKYTCRCNQFKGIRILANINIKGAEVIGPEDFMNIMCIPEGEFMLGDNKPIEDYVVGDKLLNSSGVETVYQKHKFRYDRNLIAVKAAGCLPALTTDNHPYYINGRWVRADNVKKGDWVQIPRLRGQFNASKLSLEDYIVNDGSALKSIPLDTDTAYLMGLYVAEGWRDNDRTIFCLNSKVFVDEIKRIGRKWGLIANTKRRGNSILVWFSSVVLARAFESWFGQGSRNKHIPDWLLLNNSPDVIREFLAGYEDGNGSVAKSGIVACSTASKLLAMQLQLLAARLGLFYRIYTEDFARINHNYLLHREISPQNTWRGKQHKIIDNAILVRVRDVKQKPYHGYVHNVTTPSHTILESNLITHNTEKEVREFEHDKEFDGLRGKDIVEKFQNAGFTVIRENEIALVCIDEAWAWLDSRMSGSRQNIDIQEVILQSRKKGIDIAITSQLPSAVDKRLRLNVELAVIAKKIKKRNPITRKAEVKGFKYVVASDSRVNVYVLKNENAKRYFEWYNTRESVSRPIVIDQDLNYKVKMVMEYVRKRKAKQHREDVRKLEEETEKSVEWVAQTERGKLMELDKDTKPLTKPHGLDSVMDDIQ